MYNYCLSDACTMYYGNRMVVMATDSAGKERLRSTADFAYGARRHHAPLINWTVPDAKAHEQIDYSPYSMCYSNPIKHIDFDGEKPKPLEGALIAEHVYNGQIGDILQGNWIMLKDFTSDKSYSLRMGLYGKLDTDGNITEYAVANAGTYFEKTKRGIQSVVEDILQPGGDSTDMMESIKLAKEIVNRIGDSTITFLGHSKGATEASENALATNKDAMLYNPALLDAESYGLSTHLYSRSIQAYIVKGEILSLINLFIGSKQIYSIHYLSSEHKNMILKHRIGTVIEALKKDKL